MFFEPKIITRETGPIAPSKPDEFLIVANRLPTREELSSAEATFFIIVNVFEPASLEASGLRADMTFEEVRQAVVARGLWPSHYHSVYVVLSGRPAHIVGDEIVKSLREVK